MEERFKEVLNKLSGDRKGSDIILAVSGGIDSVVMAYLFRTCAVPFAIAHCNFQLRGDDSLQDEEFVLALGEKMEAKVLLKRFETEKFASEHGVSIQMAARDLRYEWFKELAAEFNSKIAIAHHANDIAETMLFNLAKGTGLAGLHGIAQDDGIFFRPMLWAKKIEIDAFAIEKKIEWREDSSNESEKYMRNIIRKNIIPELERVNPAFITTNLRNAARIKDAEEFVRYAIAQLGLAEEKDGNICINKKVLMKLPGRRAVLYQLIKSYGFSYDQVVSIEKSQEHVGAVFIANDWVLNIDRENLIISKNDQVSVERFVKIDDKTLDFDGFSLKAEVKDANGYLIKNDNQVAALDLERLSFPLLIRNWQQGDHFIPLGMQGKKKVSDFLIDEKIPVNLKRNILVLVSREEVVWIIGYRISDQYKITSRTSTVYHVEMTIDL